MSSASGQAPVDTGKVAGRRALVFESLDEITADAERLLAGGYRRLGNWNLGPMCRHLASGFRMAWERSLAMQPWPVRALARAFFKDKALKRLPSGFKLKGKAAAALVPGDVADAEGVGELREAVARFKIEPRTQLHPVFGQLTPQEWEQLMLRHCELHLSFLLPAEGDNQGARS